MNYRQAIAQIKSERQAKLIKAELKYEKELASDKDLYSLELRKRDLICKSAYGEDRSEEIDAIDRQIKDRIIKKYGDLKEFYPSPACKLCGDTGIRNGKICECAIRLAVSDSDNIELPLHDLAEGSATASDELKSTYELMRGFCDKFPSTNIKNIVLMGGPGTGKTFLMGCIAKEIALKGSIMFLTAYGLNKRFLAYHTTFDETKNDYFEPLLDCDALIIDDLGSENVIRNVTQEYLFILLNERNLKGKATLVTTNLDMDGIKERYGAKSASRLFDKNICYAKILKGRDQRKI